MKPRNEKEAYLLRQVRHLLPKVPPASVRLRVLDRFRADLFKGLLADAILPQFCPGVCDPGEAPPALIAILLSRFSGRAVDLAKSYVATARPGLGWLVMDASGRACLSWRGQVREVNVEALRSHVPGKSSDVAPRRMFSPNNQWFLKVILLAGMDPRYWGGPEMSPLSGVSDLAHLADKPQPSASTFVQIAEEQGWLARDAEGFVVHQVPQLLEQWSYHLRNSSDRAMPVASIYPGEGVEDVLLRLRGTDDVVISGHAGAHALDLGISNVMTPRIYVRDLDAGLKDFSLARVPRDRAIAILAQPRAVDAVFRGAVKVADGLPVADILQLYLDVRQSMVRGEEQAEHIYERVLAPFFRRRQWL
jgi:hypothetical protein